MQTTTRTSFQFKGALYTLTAIQLLDPTLEGLSEQLSSKIKQAPKFFHKAPIVIDLQKIQHHGQPIDFANLSKVLRDNNLVPVAVKNANPEQQSAAIAADLAVFGENFEYEPKYNTHKDRDNPTNQSPAPKPQTNPAPTAAENVTINTPVRSGQQVYAPHGDVIIVSNVSGGAEVLAAGNIHVYGALRGRALAGINGDKNAKVFCHSLDAELVSVAGEYFVHDDLAKLPQYKKSVVVSLKDDKLMVNEL